METTVERLHSLLFSNLVLRSPVLSGNMQQNISQSGDREIIIDAPFYDMKKWKQSGVIVHTGAIINGRTAYAEWVNNLGGFATHNKSEEWVERAIEEVVYAIANEIGAEVINEL
jgi:hypothetical protein